MSDCLFCKIINGREKARIIHENDNCIAFLTPFPNTDGFTVVATKEHYPSYIFDLPKDIYLDMLIFSKEVGKILDKTLNVQRTGMIFEGMGINHAHIKLIPLHGIESKNWKPVHSNYPIFYEKYPGFIASHDGPREDELKLNHIHNQIISYKNK